MKADSIERLRYAIQRALGEHVLRPYGDSEEEPFGLGFRIDGVGATFSVLIGEGVPTGFYDIQVESHPQGGYLYMDVVSLERFVEIVKLVSGPRAFWP